MSVKKIARRYSKSLFQLSLENDNLEKVRTDIQQFLQTWEASKDLVVIMRSPVVEESDKWQIVKKTFEKNCQELTLKFFNIVIQNGRGRYLNAIAEKFLDLYDEHKGILKAKLTTAVSVNKTIKNNIKKLVAERFDKEVQLNTEIDESIIGGFILEFEEYRYDASIKNQLKNIRQKLTATH